MNAPWRVFLNAPWRGCRCRRGADSASSIGGQRASLWAPARHRDTPPANKFIRIPRSCVCVCVCVCVKDSEKRETARFNFGIAIRRTEGCPQRTHPRAHPRGIHPSLCTSTHGSSRVFWATGPPLKARPPSPRPGPAGRLKRGPASDVRGGGGRTVDKLRLPRARPPPHWEALRPALPRPGMRRRQSRRWPASPGRARGRCNAPGN